MKSTLQQLLSDGKTDQVIAELRHLTAPDPDLHEQFLLLAGRQAELERKTIAGTASAVDLDIERNKIREALLVLVKKLPEEGTAGNSIPTTAASNIAQNTQNAVLGSSIEAQTVEIGNKTIQHIDKYIVQGESSIPRHLTPAPFNSELFIGRTQLLADIESDYQQKKRLLVLVNGEGGIGKTTLAAKYWYAHENRYRHLAWLYSDTGISAALVTLREKLGVAFAPDDSPDTQVRRMAEAISNLDAPCLLVFDNANNEADLKAHYALLHRLSNCHILLTSRVRKVSDMKVLAVPPLSENEALQLFRSHYSDLNEAELPLLQDILRAVGYNTLVTEVLAKNMVAFNRYALRYSLADLLRDLQKKGLLALKNKAVQVVYGSDSLREAEPTDIISAMYDLASLSEEECYLLSNLAVLPAENIPYDFISKSIIPGDFKPSIWKKIKSFFLNKKKIAITAEVIQSLLSSLETKGWIEYSDDDNSFKISPVIQEVTKAKNSERLLDDCRSLVNTLLTGLDEDNRHQDNYQQAAVFARLGEAVIFSIPTPNINLSVLCQNIGNYHKDTGNLNLMMQAYQKMLEIQTALCEAEPDNANFKNVLAISYEKLGATQSALGDLQQALTYFEEYNRLEKELHEAFPQNVGFKNVLAISYQYLGHTQSTLGDLQRALTYFEDYNRLEKELHEAFPENVEYKNVLAISYQRLGEAHGALGDLQQALTYFEEYNRLEKELHEAFPQNMGFKDGLAVSYSKLGETYSALADLRQALTYFEELNRLEKELHEAFPQNVGFKNGLAISYWKLAETYKALKSFDLMLESYKSSNKLCEELFSSFPQNVEFKNNLAESLLSLGYCFIDTEKTEAKNYFQQAEALWQELVRDAPQYVQFQRFLGIVQEVLAGLE